MVEEEVEETVFVSELRGIVDLDRLDEALAEKNFEFESLQDDRILLRIGGQIFVGSWQQIIGTDLILDLQTKKCIGTSIKRLVAEQCVNPTKKKDPLRDIG